MSRLFEFLKGILSLALIIALVIGVPLTLISLVGFPLPTEVPSSTLIRQHLADGNVPDVFVIKALALVVWVVWIQLAAAVLVETWALLRGRVSGRVPVLPGVQAFAGNLVASTILIISAFTPGRASAVAPIVPIAQLDSVSEAVPAQVVGLAASNAVEGNQATKAMTVDSQGLVSSAAPGQYVTKSGDNWWDMAERLVGDGLRWREIRELNVGQTMTDGETVSDQTEVVQSGWRLDVPADAKLSLLDAAPPKDKDVEQIANDTTVVITPHLRLVPDVSPEPELRPATLVFEGPSGVVDSGPGVPYQVVEGDNLWDIAEQHLGDPLRWPEIYERSRDLQQSFGRTIDDPNLIWPDSILLLPTDAKAVPFADAELLSEVLESEVAEPEETEPEVEGSAEVTADDDGPVEVLPSDLQQAVDAVEASVPEPPLPPTLPSPKGPVLPVPKGPRVEPGQRTESAKVDGPAAAPEPEEVEAETEVEGPAVAAFGAGGLLVFSGLLGLLRRARRIRVTEAGEGSQPEQPPMALVDVETVLRNEADTGLAGSVYGAIELLGKRDVVVGEPLAAPEVLRVSGGHMEVVLDRPDDEIPAPWVRIKADPPPSLAGRSAARLPADAFKSDSSGNADRAVAPAFVTVGRSLLLNLEAVGVVAITGSAEASAGLVRSMVHELATGPSRGLVDIRVSDWLPGADLHSHVRCEAIDGLPKELAPWLEAAELALTGTGGFSAYALRLAGVSDSLPAPLVVFADAADAAMIQPVVEQAARHAIPLAVVFSGDLEGTGIEPAVTIEIEGGTTTVKPYGFVAATQYLSEEMVVGVEALIGHARNAAMVRRANLPHPIIASSESESASDLVLDLTSDAEPHQGEVPTEESPERDIVTEQTDDETPEITDQATSGDGGLLIRVLGPLEVSGGPVDLREEEQSLLAFLSLVGPSTADQVRDAIWPGGIDDGDFAELIEGLRSRLHHRFPDSGDGRFRVRSIVTDLGQARRWITDAESLTSDRNRNLLELALHDVRGEPFAGVTERWWQWTADHKMAIATQASTLLMDACFNLCDSAYDADDIHLAKWACDVGSRLDPLHETVTIRRVQLMMVLDQRNEAAAVVDEWESLYAATAERPPPNGPRTALSEAASDSSSEAVPQVG